MIEKVFIIYAYLIWATSAIDIDCEKTEAINEEHIHYCCKHPDGHNDLFVSCAKETNFELPNPQEQAIVDLTADRAMAASCFAHCLFSKLNFLKDKKLNIQAVKEHYQTKFSNDTEYSSEMINAFDHCHGQKEAQASDFLRKYARRGCETTSSVIMACVIRHFFHNCPESRWANTKECEATLAFSKKCRDSLVTL